MKANYTKKMIGAFALAFAILAAGAVGFAQHGDKRGGGGHRGGFGRMFHGLDLTETQQTQIQQIAERYRQNNKQIRGERRGDDGDRYDALASGTFDEAAVRAAAQAHAAKRVEMEVAHARMMSEMYAVLTSEQKTKIAEMRQQHEQRRQQRRAARGANAVNQN